MFYFPINIGLLSSSQLTPYFFRGGGPTTNQTNLSPSSPPDQPSVLPAVPGTEAWQWQVTKKMVGKEDDLEQDLPLMDLGLSWAGQSAHLGILRMDFFRF